MADWDIELSLAAIFGLIGSLGLIGLIYVLDPWVFALWFVSVPIVTYLVGYFSPPKTDISHIVEVGILWPGILAIAPFVVAATLLYLVGMMIALIGILAKRSRWISDQA